jgi:hypothetical protein
MFGKSHQAKGDHRWFMEIGVTDSRNEPVIEQLTALLYEVAGVVLSFEAKSILTTTRGI